MTFRKDLMANFMGGPGYFQNILSSKIFWIKEDNEIVVYFKDYVLMYIIYDYIGFILT